MTSATATCSRTCCVASDAVYHFAAYQDYLTDFARFTEVNVASTALIYEIAVAEGLDLARVVVASSQSAMGEGLYRCVEHGEQTPPMRTEDALARRRWDHVCPVCEGPLEMQRTPESVSNPQNAYGMSKLGEEMVAVNLGRRYGIPTVALRYSIVQGPRQSVYNAYSGACRIFCLHYLLGSAPVLYEDGAMIRDYVNIHDVVAANVLALTDDRAVGRVFNVGGGTGYTTAQFADIVRDQYASVRLRTGQRGVPLRRHPAHRLRHPSPARARVGAEAHPGRLGRRVRRLARGHARSRPRPRRGGRQDAVAGRRAEGRRVKAVLLAAGLGHPAAPAHRPHAQVPGRGGRSAAARHLAGRARRRRRRRRPGQRAPPGGPGAGPRRAAGRWPAGAPRARARAAGQRRDAGGQPGLPGRGGHVPGHQRRQPHRLRPARARRRRTATAVGRRRSAVFRTPRPRECGIVEVQDGLWSGFEEKPAHPRSDLANAGLYAFEPEVDRPHRRCDARATSASTCCPHLVGRAGAVDIGDAYFIDIGTPEALEPSVA